MPEIEPYLADDGVTRVSPPSPRTALFWDGTHWHVPRVDDEGRVQVRGEDQLFSYDQALVNRRQAVISGANGFLDSNSPPAGQIWRVANIAVLDATSPTTGHTYDLRRAGVNHTWYGVTAAMGVNVASFFHGDLWLDPGDVLRIWFWGSLVGDTCRIDLLGYQMTLEV